MCIRDSHDAGRGDVDEDIEEAVRQIAGGINGTHTNLVIAPVSYTHLTLPTSDLV